MRFWIAYCFLFLAIEAYGQLNGTGLMDGVYRVEIEFDKESDDVMEGTISYQGEMHGHPCVGSLRGDTFRCHELDDFHNPVASLVLVKVEDHYTGMWTDLVNRYQLPVSFYIGKNSITPKYSATRFSIDWTSQMPQKIFEWSLSPTVQLGKYIDRSRQRTLSFSQNKTIDKTVNFTNHQNLSFPESEKEESIKMVDFRFDDGYNSFEAIIPNFGETFVDSLQSALVRWKENLAGIKKSNIQSRFPDRYYAICDLDYWTKDWVCGSFEYVSPLGEGDGFVFIYDRRSHRFLSFDELLRSGSVSEIIKYDDALGLTFDYYGIIVKNKFNPIKHRNNKHIHWAELDLRVKRKLNELQK